MNLFSVCGIFPLAERECSCYSLCVVQSTIKFQVKQSECVHMQENTGTKISLKRGKKHFKYLMLWLLWHLVGSHFHLGRKPQSPSSACLGLLRIFDWHFQTVISLWHPWLHICFRLSNWLLHRCFFSTSRKYIKNVQIWGRGCGLYGCVSLQTHSTFGRFLKILCGTLSRGVCSHI